MKLTERALKDQLAPLAENDFQLPAGADVYQRTLEMMPHLGSPDSELRDQLIYSCLATWILDDAEMYSEEQYKNLLKITLDEEHLTYHLGEQNNDTVFTRSFSMLVLPLILIAHRRRPFLSKEEVLSLKVKVIDYLGKENDLRGYIVEEDKGWAHAVAHTADALDDLARCRELVGEDLKDILAAIQNKVAESDIVYNYEEDERMTIAVIACLERKLLKETEVTEWLHRFIPLAQQQEPFPASYRQALNIKNFLRSLYFRAQKEEVQKLIGQESAEALVALVGAVLAEINRF